MKVRYCYFGLIDSQDNETLIEKLRFIHETISRYSHKYQICGIFYYANQSFFHCLEGKKETVHKLLSYLHASGKLIDIKVYQNISIESLHYQTWSMKYVHKESDIIKFFNKIGHQLFCPLLLNDKNIDKLVNIIFSEISNESINKLAKGYKNRGKSFY